MEYNEIMQKIKSLSDPEAVRGMARFGINTDTSYGVSVYDLRKLAKETGKDHALAKQLWESGIHEAHILASMVDKPEMVTDVQMENWVKGFNSWDVCDLCCSNLFDKTRFAYQKAEAWSEREEQFVKRAGFVLMAALAVHDKTASDEELIKFMPIIKRESTDDRNFVKKAVNWALRQIGKRNLSLNQMAIKTAEEIGQIDSRSARWIAADALRELTGEPVQKRLTKKK
ncbi:DNA alkylation repair protein [Chloroflexota bacterium]